jgi:hypothetical protein
MAPQHSASRVAKWHYPEWHTGNGNSAEEHSVSVVTRVTQQNDTAEFQNDTMENDTHLAIVFYETRIIPLCTILSVILLSAIQQSVILLSEIMLSVILVIVN